MIRDNRESSPSPETAHKTPFFKPSNAFERHLAPRNGKQGGRLPGQETNEHRWISPEQVNPPPAAPETVTYWQQVSEQHLEQHSLSTKRTQEDLSSHGPLLGMPIFGPQNEEIMTVVDKGGEFVTIYTEDPENVGRLIPTDLYRKDYLELLRHQPKILPHKK